jgi:aminoglycoside phosphotransferase
MIGVALERKQVSLSVLSEAERETLIGLLQRLHENLPAVESATARHVESRFAQARRRARAKSDDED